MFQHYLKILEENNAFYLDYHNIWSLSTNVSWWKLLLDLSLAIAH